MFISKTNLHWKLFYIAEFRVDKRVQYVNKYIQRIYPIDGEIIDVLN